MKQQTISILFMTLLTVFILMLNSCAIKDVKSWQKGTLAKDTMRFGGPNPMLKKFDESIYASKESTKGGGGVAGGGCGCN